MNKNHSAAAAVLRAVGLTATIGEYAIVARGGPLNAVVARIERQRSHSVSSWYAFSETDDETPARTIARGSLILCALQVALLHVPDKY